MPRRKVSSEKSKSSILFCRESTCARAEVCTDYSIAVVVS